MRGQLPQPPRLASARVQPIRERAVEAPHRNPDPRTRRDLQRSWPPTGPAALPVLRGIVAELPMYQGAAVHVTATMTCLVCFQPKRQSLRGTRIDRRSQIDRDPRVSERDGTRVERLLRMDAYRCVRSRSRLGLIEHFDNAAGRRSTSMHGTLLHQGCCRLCRSRGPNGVAAPVPRACGRREPGGGGGGAAVKRSGVRGTLEAHRPRNSRVAAVAAGCVAANRHRHGRGFGDGAHVAGLAWAGCPARQCRNGGGASGMWGPTKARSAGFEASRRVGCGPSCGRSVRGGPRRGRKLWKEEGGAAYGRSPGICADHAGALRCRPRGPLRGPLGVHLGPEGAHDRLAAADE